MDQDDQQDPNFKQVAIGQVRSVFVGLFLFEKKKIIKPSSLTKKLLLLFMTFSSESSFDKRNTSGQCLEYCVFEHLHNTRYLKNIQI